jgi:hypothetical protein
MRSSVSLVPQWLGNKQISARNHHWKKSAEPGKIDCYLPRAVMALFASLPLLSACHPGSRQVRAPDSTMPQRNINAVLRNHDQELLAIPGVVGVYVGLRSDQKTPCLRVMALKKTKELERALPKSLEGYPVEIEETGEIRPMERR